MSRRNVLSSRGREILDLADQALRDCVEAPVGPLNEAVTALAKAVEALVLNTQPLWSVEEIDDSEVEP